VPAGIYARQWLEKLSCDSTDTTTAWDAVADRIAPAPNVRAALGMVEANRDIPGIVYATDAAMSDKVSVIYQVSGNDAPVITYHAALVENKSSHERTKLFLQFLTGEQVSEVFQSYGFSVPEMSDR
jgi:molybdate transport system substrate-binding protein